MASRNRGLGKGLDAMIPDHTGAAAGKASTKKKKSDSPEQEEEVSSATKGHETLVDIKKIDRNKEQPRKKFDEGKLEELAESIRLHGIIQPLLVQDRGDYYEIIAGERRWRAALKAGVTEIPVIIKNLTEQEIVEISLIENLQREDLDPIEEAAAFKRLKEEFSLTDDQVAERVSKSRAAVTNSMRLLRLDQRVQQMVIDEKLTSGHVRALIPIADFDLQYELALEAFDRRLSVREVEKMVKSLGKPKKDKKPDQLARYQIHFDEYAEKISGELGTKVSVNLKDKSSGKLEIEFYNNDDFEKIYRILTGK